MAKPKEFIIEDAQILFRNFAGNEDQYNRAGDRNFACVLPEDVAEAMTADGWNVKWLEPRDEEDTATAYIQVAVGYKVRPPKVVMISSTARTNLGEDSVEVLDYSDIQTVDLIATGYDWEVNGKSGTKAYLKSMFITIEEDALERKYAQVSTAEPMEDED